MRVFQPIVDLTSAVIVGVEALSRFTGGARSPSVWFADAASVGMLEELELFALTTAQADATSVPEGVYVSVNVSPSTMCDARFVPTLVLPPQRLVCEVTEHAAIDDYGTLAAALQSFREAGGRLAVDDAGAGYASLHHILKLHPDVIKLDIGLTRAVHEHPARRALVAALVAFSNDIGAGLVAEGIETQAELDALRDLGVGFGQGYHLARPAPIGELLPELSSA